MNNNKIDIFKAVKVYPFHLSIGAILVNENGEICCHYYKDGLPYESGNEGDLYLLMRETPHEEESIVAAISRGIMEEFGAEGEIVHYLGTIESWFPGVKTGIKIHKTTIYFLVRMTSFNVDLRDKSDVESESELLWLKPEKLRDIFLSQGKRFERTDLDESKVIQNYIDYIQTAS